MLHQLDELPQSLLFFSECRATRVGDPIDALTVVGVSGAFVRRDELSNEPLFCHLLQ